MRVHEARNRVPHLVLVHVETVGTSAFRGPPQGGPPSEAAGVEGTPSHEDARPDKSTQKASLERYRRSTAEVLSLLHRLLPGSTMEKASIDEVYIDVTAEVETALRQRTNPGTWAADHAVASSHIVGGSLTPGLEFDQRLAQGAALAARIRGALYDELGYTSSAGIASNKLLAKIASAMHKPNQQTLVPPRGVPDLMQGLPLHKLRNFGGKLGDVLLAMGCATAGDVGALPPDTLTQRFGAERAAAISDAVRGISSEPVKAREVTKSMLAAKSFNYTRDLAVLRSWFHVLANELGPRLAQDADENQRRAKTLTIYYRNKADGEHSRVFAMPRFRPGEPPDPEILAEAAYTCFTKGCLADALPCSRLAMAAGDFASLPVAGHNAITRFYATRSDARKGGEGTGVSEQGPKTSAMPAVEHSARPLSPPGSPAGSGSRGEDPLLAGVDVRQQAALLREVAMLHTLRKRTLDSGRDGGGTAPALKKKTGKTGDSQLSITRFMGRKASPDAASP